MSDDALSAAASRLGGALRSNGKTVELVVPASEVRAACLAVSALPGLYHLSTITGFDDGKDIELLYHFWEGKRFYVVRTSVPKSSPRIASVSQDLQSAVLYEAEIQDILGVAFEGNPYLGKRLLLPDDYPPQAPPPLRKEADPEEIRKMMELE